jgi:hypothetical protein
MGMMSTMSTANLSDKVKGMYSEAIKKQASNQYEAGMMRIATSDGYGLMYATTDMDFALDSDAQIFMDSGSISSWRPASPSLTTKAKVRAWLCPYCRRMTLHKPERQESCEGCGSTHWKEVLTEE